MTGYDLPELNAWLDQFLNFEKLPDRKILKIETMRQLCEYFGHPELACPALHVGGSKGKGTIAAMTAQLLRARGYRVGVYTSPHVLHFSERVSMGTEPFSLSIYETAATELQDGVEKMVAEGRVERGRLTWFELVTLYAMLVFRAAECEVAIYEVGMGGRLDATNVISPMGVALGLIEYEHTEYLGETIAEIAGEKAGIIKPGVPVVVAPQIYPEALDVFEQRAREQEAPLTVIESDGNYLAQDAAVATALVRCIVPDLTEAEARRTLRRLRLTGRFEGVVPNVIVDGAHTVESLRAVLERMQDELAGRKLYLLFGCAKDKQVEQMAQEIADSRLFERIWLTEPGDFKKADLPRMEQAFAAAGLEHEASRDFDSIIRQALAAARADEATLMVLGSFYLAGEVKQRV